MPIGEAFRALIAVPAVLSMSLAGTGENPQTVGVLVGIASILAGVVLLYAGHRLR